MRKITFAFYVLTLLSTTSMALAAEETYDFNIVIDRVGPSSGPNPYIGDIGSGSFSFDSSLIPAGGGRVDRPDLVASFDIRWNGPAVGMGGEQESAYLEFDNAGQLTGFAMGSTCLNGLCGVPAGGDLWALASADASSGRFFYSPKSIIPGSTPAVFGDFTYERAPAPAPAAVPLPGPLGLMGAGLAVLSLVRRSARGRRV